MEINLEHPTQDQIAALKLVAPALADSLGLIDPTKPLSREQAETVEFTHRINGIDVTKSGLEWAKDASKGEGADAKFREATELAKKAEPALALVQAQERFRNALAANQMPKDADIKAVADSLGVPVENLMGSITDEEEEEGEKAGKKAAAQQQQQAWKPGPGSITLEMLAPNLQDDLMFVGEEKGGKAKSYLDTLIQKSLDNDKSVANLISRHGGNQEQVAAFKEVLFENAKDQIEGRIRQLPQGADLALVTRTINDSVIKTAQRQERAGIPTKTAPQPIILGPSEPGGQEVRILSDAKVPTDLPMDHPDFVRNQSLIAAQNQAKAMALEAESSV